MINPIVTSILYLGLAFSTILSKTWYGLSVFAILSIILIILNITYIKFVFKQVKPFLLFLPAMMFIYLIISFIFTNTIWTVILKEAGFAISKLLLLVIVMSLYIEISKKHNLVLAIRSIWSKLNLEWRKVDDMFMYLELTLRFYPTFQREWQILNRSKKALGIVTSESKWKRVRSVADDLPGMILQSYRKAENTALIMQQRGYGRQIPRGVANPILFKVNDLLFIVIIVTGYILLNRYVSL